MCPFYKPRNARAAEVSDADPGPCAAANPTGSDSAMSKG